MLTLQTNDGRTHSANTWHDLLESAQPEQDAAVTMAQLIRKAKQDGFDVLFGATMQNAPSGNKLLWRLHEVGMVNLVIDKR